MIKIDTIKKRIVKKFNGIKKHYEKNLVNENWHTRYNNLESKYNELIVENEKLKKKLDADLQNHEIERLRKDCLNYKRQRDNLRKELKEKESRN